MFINGKKIAEALKERLRTEAAYVGKELELKILQVSDDPVSTRYVAAKKKFGESLGINVEHEQFPEGTTEEELIDIIDTNTVPGDDLFRGMIVQLPLPRNMDVERVLNTIPLENDVDVLSEAARDAYENNTTLILPPVVGALEHIFELHGVDLEDKHVALVGYGRLVGRPVATWLERSRAQVTILTQNDPLLETLQEADIVISGTGTPNLIQPEMLKEGVVLIDVGTSDEGGELRGDIDLRCAAKAALFCPVPGGIGPITMAMLFRNLIELARNS